MDHGIKDIPKDEKKSATAELSAQDSLLIALKYRDRASERRSKHKSPEPDASSAKKLKKHEHSNGRRQRECDYEPVSAPAQNLLGKRDNHSFRCSMISILICILILIETESVASKLMKKMGWSEGSGIGKNLQGISAPIEVIDLKYLCFLFLEYL